MKSWNRRPLIGRFLIAGVDGRGAHRRARLDERRRGHRHRLGHGADLQRLGVDGLVCADVRQHERALCGREAGELGDEVVVKPGGSSGSE